MGNTNLVFESIFKKSSSETDTKDFLLSVTEEHPYFSPAHFFLLQQTNKTSSLYKKQAAKTAILFNNPYWLNFQINKPPQETVISSIPVNQIEEDDLPETVEREIAPIKVELNLADINTTEDTINFEPLHTSDYFASQGIKLSEQVLPTDKLGMQLKSFTQWLKTMKKIHIEELTGDTTQTDTTIQKLAEKSNTEDETLTEAMADVLVQQGKSGKALELYKKLSLLNPSKSAYFAAKIEQLKD